MGKKIVILNGSPRKAGNTAALTAEFTKGAKEAGNTVIAAGNALVSKEMIWIKFILR